MMFLAQGVELYKALQHRCQVTELHAVCKALSWLAVRKEGGREGGKSGLRMNLCEHTINGQ